MTSITKEFPGVKALSDVNLTVYPGEIHAICGENGAGKSTLMKVLSGVHPVGTYEGEIRFDGEVCEFRNIRDSEHKGIAIIHQELALSPYLSIAENIFMGNERAKSGVIDWNATNAEAAKLLKMVGLDSDPLTRIVDIGVGRQQLVEIAKALSKDVKLLILDEPTAALNDEDSASSSTSATPSTRASRSSPRNSPSPPTSRSPRTSSSATSRPRAGSSTGTGPTPKPPSCSQWSASTPTQ